MSYQIQEINRRIQADPKEFVDACDAAYAEKIERAARADAAANEAQRIQKTAQVERFFGNFCVFALFLQIKE